MRHAHRRWAGAVAITSTMAIVASVQVGGTAFAQQSISADLRMLMTRPGDDATEVTAGPPPADFPMEVLPRGTTPVASTINGNRTVVVGTMAGRAPGWRTDFLSQVSAAGWISQMPAQAGFMSGPSDTAAICKGTDFADVALVAGRAGAINVRATVTRDPRRQCASHGPGAAMSFADVTFPTLEAPAGAKMTEGGGNGSSSDWASHAQLITELPMGALADFYRRQIGDAGWIEDGAPALVENAMVVRYKVPSRIGPALPGMFIVSAFEQPGRFDLLLRLVRPPDRVGGSR